MVTLVTMVTMVYNHSPTTHLVPKLLHLVCFSLQFEVDGLLEMRLFPGTLLTQSRVMGLLLVELRLHFLKGYDGLCPHFFIVKSQK